jgi:hypothetical protein
VAAVAVAAAALGACGGDGAGDEAAFCATAERFAADNPASVFDRYDPADPASAATLLRDAADRLRDWGDDAPRRVRVDIDAIAEAADGLADEFETPEAAASEDLQAQLAAVETASARALDHTRETCGVDLDPAVTSTTPTTAQG